MYYLNTHKALELMKIDREHKIYIDKSMIIRDLYRYSQDVSRYVAITKPRRFGKTMVANMLAAFFAKGQDATGVFEGLKISNCTDMVSLKNTLNVFHIDFLSELHSAKSYPEFEHLVCERMISDTRKAFPSIRPAESDSLP